MVRHTCRDRRTHVLYKPHTFLLNKSSKLCNASLCAVGVIVRRGCTLWVREEGKSLLIEKDMRNLTSVTVTFIAYWDKKVREEVDYINAPALKHWQLLLFISAFYSLGIEIVCSLIDWSLEIDLQIKGIFKDFPSLLSFLLCIFLTFIFIFFHLPV